MTRTRLLAAALLGAVAVAAVVGLAGLSALSAAKALQRAQVVLAAAVGGQAGAAQTMESLERARVEVEHAEQALARWPVDVVATVPVLGRSWRAERAVTRTADSVIAGAAVLVGGTAEVSASSGGVDLVALTRVRDELAAPAGRSRAALHALRSVSLDLTPPPVRTGVRTAQDQLGYAVDALQQAHSGLAVLGGVLGESGPRTVLVMLQNNAELRGAGGYSASFALGRAQDGRLDLAPLRDVVAVADPPQRARRVPAPAEYVEDYGVLSGNTTMWRSWNMSPHVPDSALVAARIADVLLPEQPDVVVLLDVPALGALAALGGGPVVLPDGTSVPAEQLTRALLVDAYAAAGQDVGAQVARRAALQSAATTAVNRLVSGEVPVDEAARTLARLAAQRHLSVWSARAAEQEALVRLGVAGGVSPPEGGDLVHVSVNNVGGNKLDQYVDREVEVDVALTARAAAVVQRVRFTNRAPEGLVPYVAGAEEPGRVTSLVELSLPPAAALSSATVGGEPWLGTHHTGGLRQRLRTRLEIPRGDSAVLEVRYRLPIAGLYRLRLVPQPLVEDARLALSVRPVGDHRLIDVHGDRRGAGRVFSTGAFAATRELAVGVRPPSVSRWDRILEWWG